MADVQMGVTPEVVIWLFKRMAELFGHDRMALRYPDGTSEDTIAVWIEVLSDQPSVKIKRAAWALDSTDFDGWPPSLSQFKRLVIESVARPEAADTTRDLKRLEQRAARRDSPVVLRELGVLRDLKTALEERAKRPPPLVGTGEAPPPIVDEGGCTCPIRGDRETGQWVDGSCPVCTRWYERRQAVANAAAAIRMGWEGPA